MTDAKVYPDDYLGEQHPRVIRTPWRERLIFNTWRAPFPYLFHRWDVVMDAGWCGGWWRRSRAEAWVAEYEAAP